MHVFEKHRKNKRDLRKYWYKQNDFIEQFCFVVYMKILRKAFKNFCVLEMTGKKEIPKLDTWSFGIRNNEKYSEIECWKGKLF